MINSDKTPRFLGFRMPAEFEKQEAIWLAWPHNKDTWPGKLLEDVENSYIKFIKALHSGQKVKILINDKEKENYVKNKLNNLKINLSKISNHPNLC